MSETVTYVGTDTGVVQHITFEDDEPFEEKTMAGDDGVTQLFVREDEYEPQTVVCDECDITLSDAALDAVDDTLMERGDTTLCPSCLNPVPWPPDIADDSGESIEDAESGSETIESNESDDQGGEKETAEMDGSGLTVEVDGGLYEIDVSVDHEDVPDGVDDGEELTHDDLPYETWAEDRPTVQKLGGMFSDVSGNASTDDILDGLRSHEPAEVANAALVVKHRREGVN